MVAAELEPGGATRCRLDASAAKVTETCVDGDIVGASARAERLLVARDARVRGWCTLAQRDTRGFRYHRVPVRDVPRYDFYYYSTAVDLMYW